MIQQNALQGRMVGLGCANHMPDQSGENRRIAPRRVPGIVTRRRAMRHQDVLDLLSKG